MHRKPVQEIMQRAVITVEPDALVVDAAHIMEEFDVRRLPVVDEDDRLVGIVTDSDILEAETAASVLGNYAPDTRQEWLTIADIMTRELITVSPETTVGQVVRIFMQQQIGGAPVIESSPSSGMKLIGIVTEQDVFSMILHAWEEEEIARGIAS